MCNIELWKKKSGWCKGPPFLERFTIRLMVTKCCACDFKAREKTQCNIAATKERTDVKVNCLRRPCALLDEYQLRLVCLLQFWFGNGKTQQSFGAWQVA